MALMRVANASRVARSTRVSTGSDSFADRYGLQSMVNSSALTCTTSVVTSPASSVLRITVDQRLATRPWHAAFAIQPRGVQLARGLHRADLLVHQRLGRSRLVGLVVAVAAVADQVDDHVLA
jgi:hypothetical protein